MLDEERIACRYRAFISYSHHDAAFGRMLHRRLETYRIPGKLVGQVNAHGVVPARLAPIFRDREELPASDDLSAEVRAALSQSASLIVICSPYARVSPWVAREIDLFRELHGNDRPVLAALIAGDPIDAFPPAIGRLKEEGHRLEPIAADFRRGGDGHKLALFKLVAGLTGLNLDALVQRDAQRQLRRVIAVTLAVSAALLVTGLSLIATVRANKEAVLARNDAQWQQREAQAMVDYMLTDLRPRLVGVGRLDILGPVNARALGYYKAQEKLQELSPASLERRARILHAMGEDEVKAGELPAAREKFIEAARTTQALLAQEPNDPQRIFVHAQSEYWVGYIDYEQGFAARNLASAKKHFLNYRTLAQRLTRLAPRNAAYAQELGYAEGNLCSISLAEPMDRAEALRACAAALDHMERAARLSGTHQRFEADLANRHAWLADAWKANGDSAKALLARKEQERLINGMIARDPRNMDHKDFWLTSQVALAELEAPMKSRELAEQRLATARALVEEMTHFDPANQEWADRRNQIKAAQLKLRRN